MMKQISKYRILLIILFLLVWSFTTETPFQKGGIDQYMHYVIFGIIIMLGFLFLVPYRYPKFIILEKILYLIISSLVGLAVSVTGTGKVLEKIYGPDYHLNLENLISNLIFYFSTSFISIGILYIIVKLKSNRTDSQQRN